MEGGIKLSIFFRGLVLIAMACNRDPGNSVKTKVFMLNPNEYIGTTVEISGRVTQVGPGDAYFTLEDDTGKVLVTSEHLSTGLNCPLNSRILISGRLASLKSITGLYFSLDQVLACN